ncbi:hypothetical protein GKQ77_01545 [Streptomyces sp. BG9H]|uniref:GAF domain-containing protein n=1 Tax=Streptomyces anatolicus TaxID=2675858 RepID=A0ABS6YFS2_9ACTN|nr:hypothetical protein [Streptomyces anatolicus]MBW5420254.1 hypothetical protein [Streptomyces anatolicus]
MIVRQDVNQIATWLAYAQRAPEQAQREWSDTGVALLPLGSRFEVARLPERLVLAAVCTTAPQAVAVLLGRALNGPVIYDNLAMGGTYYALMRPRAERAWTHQAVAPCLGAGSYLGVPRIGRTEPPGTYWVVPPRFEGDLCEPETVEALISFGLGVHQEAQR